MPTRWDPLIAAATARELDSKLRGSRARALLLDLEARRFFLFLRDHTLVVELHPLQGWLMLLPPRDPPDEARAFSCTVLRVFAPPDESAVVFELQRVRGRSESARVVLEMIGNRWNALIVGRESQTIRHVLVPREDRVRSLTVGASYQLPPSTQRLGSEGALDEREWGQIVASVASEEGARRAEILQRIAWTSALNVDSLLGPDGWSRWRRMIEPTEWGGVLIDTPRGPQPYPVAPGDSVTARTFPTLVDAFHMGRELDQDAQPLASLFVPSYLLAEAERRLAQARKKERGVRRELAETTDPAEARVVGDLLLARLSEIPRKAKRTVVLDFEGTEVELELDPALTPSENAAQYYSEASRLERARDTLPKLIRKAEASVEKWADLLDRVRSGTSDPAGLVEALGPIQPSQKVGSKDRPKPLPFRRFVSSGGHEIRVGRGPRQNDDLTFRHSAPNDIWLHVRQTPGAHVVLRWQGDGTPPRQDLAEAATLAALHSSARHSGSVPVAWTRRKHVRKPRGAPPGTVTPERTRTVFVSPDLAVIERLGDKS